MDENSSYGAGEHGPQRGWGFPRELQLGEPGPRGRVGKGKSKYLRYLDSKWIFSTHLEAMSLGGYIFLGF